MADEETGNTANPGMSGLFSPLCRAYFSTCFFVIHGLKVNDHTVSAHGLPMKIARDITDQALAAETARPTFNAGVHNRQHTDIPTVWITPRGSGTALRACFRQFLFVPSVLASASLTKVIETVFFCPVL